MVFKNGGVVGVDDGLIDAFSDDYPRGANSIGSNPSSSRFSTCSNSAWSKTINKFIFFCKP